MKTFFWTILKLLLICIMLSCESKKKEFTLIGKWQLEERISGDGGGKNYHEKISDGRTLEFKENGEVINELDQKGKYKLEKENTYSSFLHISFPNSGDEYFSVYHEESNSEKMMLNPNNSEHQIICDCGCTEVYFKD